MTCLFVKDYRGFCGLAVFRKFFLRLMSLTTLSWTKSTIKTTREDSCFFHPWDLTQQNVAHKLCFQRQSLSRGLFQKRDFSGLEFLVTNSRATYCRTNYQGEFWLRNSKLSPWTGTKIVQLSRKFTNGRHCYKKLFSPWNLAEFVQLQTSLGLCLLQSLNSCCLRPVQDFENLLLDSKVTFYSFVLWKGM